MLFRILLAVYAAVGLAVQVVEDIKADGQLNGPEARALAIAKVKELVTAAVGFYPWWLPDALIGSLIDIIVRALNDKGVFSRSAPDLGPAI
jgi:hypothetical protein